MMGPNEFTDVEHFGFEHHRRPNTILAMTLAERPRTGITLTANGSTSYVIIQYVGAARQ